MSRSASRRTPEERRALAAAGLAGALSFALYLASNHPFASHHDAAEFQTLARTGGIAHAGYPALILLLRFFGGMPFSTLAFRANLLSGLAGAVAVGLSAYGGARLTGRWWAGLVGAGALALSYSLWSASSVAGVHAFTLALDAALYVLALRFVARPARGTALALGLSLGVGLVSHLTVLAILPALGVAVLLARRTGNLRRIHAILGLVGLLIGLALLAYLWAQDKSDQPMNYLGYTLDLQSGQHFPAGTPPLSRWQRLAWLLSARQVIEQEHFHLFERALPRLKFLAAHAVVNELPWWGLLFAAIGLAALARERRREGLLLGLWLATTLFLLLLGADFASVPDFFMPGTWALSQAAAAGVAAWGNGRHGRIVLSGLLIVAAPALRLVLPHLPVALDRHGALHEAWALWPERFHPFRADRAWDEYGRQVMAGLPARAVLLCCWDEGMTMRYFRYGEVLRKDVDVRITCRHPGRVTHALAEAARDRRPVFSTFDPAEAELPVTGSRVGHWRPGGLFRIRPRGT